MCRENHLKKIIILFLGVWVVGGCAKVSHLDQLLTLKGLADEQTEMSRDIEAQDQKFNAMLEEMKAGTLDQYLNKGKYLRTFGEPVYVKRIHKNNQEMEKWSGCNLKIFIYQKINTWATRHAASLLSSYLVPA